MRTERGKPGIIWALLTSLYNRASTRGGISTMPGKRRSYLGQLILMAPLVSGVVHVESTAAQTAEASNGNLQLQEIVVTAQKREENLLDVPASISAISGNDLESLHVNSLSDLAGYVPGLSVMDAGSPGFRTLVMRGLNTSYNNQSVPAMVGTYIDDLPIGSSSGQVRGANYGLDLVPYDIDHIEVLKGPQGTLYGANTMGGLIKYVLKKPDLNEFEGRVGGDAVYIQDSGGPSGAIRGAVNIPIVAGSAALRLSGFDRYTAGYIDNVQLGTTDVNHSTESGGRATLRWQVTQSLELQASALAQTIDTASMSGVNLDPTVLAPLYGYNKESAHFREPFEQQSRFYSLSVKWNLGFAKLSSSTGWSSINGTEVLDLTDPFQIYIPQNPDGFAPTNIADDVSKFVEELRLASPGGQRVDWMLGGYYTKEDSSEHFLWPTYTHSYTLLTPPDWLVDYHASGAFKETAGFANATYHVFNRFDLSGGVRHSNYSEAGCTQGTGVFGAGFPPCTALPNRGVTLWMANASYRFAKDSMGYARVSTGYRPGSGCPTCGNEILGIPGIVNPDRTTNYEVGFKGNLGQRLQMQLSAFYIDWTDIQINKLTPQGFNYAGNGSGARSSGVEFEGAYRPVQSLSIVGSLAYTDAHLTQDIPTAGSQAGGQAGDQLPNSPLWSASVMADYTRPMARGYLLLLGTAYRYRDAVVNQFAHSGNPFPSPPQNVMDAYVGLSIDKLDLRLYARNLFNDRSYSGLMYVSDPKSPRYVPIQPVTLGLSADYRF